MRAGSIWEAFKSSFMFGEESTETDSVYKDIISIFDFFFTLLEVDGVREREYSWHRADAREKQATLSNGIFSQQEKLCLTCVKRSR